MNCHFTQFRGIKTLVIALFTVVFYSGQTPALAQSKTELIDQLRARYDQVELMRADFTQRITSPFGEDLPENEGTLIIEGDSYRVEAGTQTFVTNGETSWVYDAYEKQLLINDYVDDDATFSLSKFLDNFHEEFTVLNTRTVNQTSGRLHEMQLEAQSSSAFFKEVTLWMRTTDQIITRLKVIDANDAILDFYLEDIEINPFIEQDPFTFTPPEDTRIIDLRS